MVTIPHYPMDSLKTIEKSFSSMKSMKMNSFIMIRLKMNLIVQVLFSEFNHYRQFELSSRGLCWEDYFN